MGISIIYGIDLEKHIRKIYNIFDNGTKSKYWALIDSIKHLNLSYIYTCRDTGSDFEIYFGINDNSKNAIQKYENILCNIDDIFDKMKKEALDIRQDDIEEFSYCSGYDNFPEAWDNFLLLKECIKKSIPSYIGL